MSLSGQPFCLNFKQAKTYLGIGLIRIFSIRIRKKTEILYLNGRMNYYNHLQHRLLMSAICKKNHATFNFKTVDNIDSICYIVYVHLVVNKFVQSFSKQTLLTWEKLQVNVHLKVNTVQTRHAWKTNKMLEHVYVGVNHSMIPLH